MVYIKKWIDFETAATDLYAKAPTKVRYCVKFLPKTGQLILKLTDDTTCIKYKTFSSIILNRFESLNLRLLSQIANVRPRSRSAPSEGVDEEEAMNVDRVGTPARAGTQARGGTPVPASKAGGTGATPVGGGGAVGKKKKKGKR